MSTVTIKDVARKAGVSFSTAAAALRGERIVRPDTCRKVEAAAQALGYRKNSAAAVLSSHQKRNQSKSAFIAWISGLAEWNLAETPVIKVAIVNAAAEAEKEGLQFEYHNVTDPASAPHLLRQLEARGCDGIVLDLWLHSLMPKLPWQRYAVVSNQEIRLHEGFDIVRTDQFRGTLSLLRRIRASGYRRIGICLREHVPYHPDDEMRYGAACTFQTMDLKMAERLPIKRISFHSPNTEAELTSWTRKYTPDVVVGFTRTEYDILFKNGFSIPDDFAYVSLHVEKKDRGLIAGLEFNQELIPKYALKVLMEKMRHGMRGLSEFPQETVYVPPLIPGDSCPDLILQ